METLRKQVLKKPKFVKRIQQSENLKDLSRKCLKTLLGTLFDKGRSGKKTHILSLAAAD